MENSEQTEHKKRSGLSGLITIGALLLVLLMACGLCSPSLLPFELASWLGIAAPTTAPSTVSNTPFVATPVMVTTPIRPNSAPTLSATATPVANNTQATPAPTLGKEYKLTIIHTSENHGHWEPFTQTIAFGGIARRATAIQKIRAAAPNSLLLDSGDVAQGSLYFVQHRMIEAAQFYNALGYDAVCIGNHEFDYGPKTFAENYIANAKFAIVSANLDFAAEPLLAGKIPATLIKTIGGEPIGLLGLTTPEVATASSPGPHIKAKAPIEAARAAVAELEKQGVNKIIVISHLGYPADRTLAAAVDGIDVIVSGHTATLLGNAATLSKDLGTPDGPYPTIVKSPSGANVLIVHAFEWGKLLGRLNVTFDAKGVATQWDGEASVVDTQLAEDANVRALLDKLAAPLADKRKEVIAQTSVLLDGERAVVRTRESNLGNLIADAMLAATKNEAQIALMNGGGIRTSIKVGDITVGDVLEALPFGNRLVQFDLKGADVIAALENGVSRVNPANPGESAGRFPQVAGLRFTWDATRTPRIVSTEVGSTSGGYKPLDPNATYRVVTNDFMAGGGDGYEVFKNGTNRSGGDVPIDEALREYVSGRGVLAPQTEGRIRSAGAGVSQPPTPAAAQVAAPPVVVAAAASLTLPKAGAAHVAPDWLTMTMGVCGALSLLWGARLRRGAI